MKKSVNAFERMIKRRDPESKSKVYSFKLIKFSSTEEYNLEEVLRIWDILRAQEREEIQLLPLW